MKILLLILQLSTHSFGKFTNIKQPITQKISQIETNSTRAAVTHDTVDWVAPMIANELDYSLDSVKYAFESMEARQKGINQVKGAFLVFISENQLSQILSTMATINKDLHYPWIFLHNASLSSTFKFAVQSFTENEVKFGQSDHISRHVPKNVLENAISNVQNKGKDYKALDTVMHMRQLYSGLFVNHSLLNNIDYIWRVRFPKIILD